jgi:hypothetical protein
MPFFYPSRRKRPVPGAGKFLVIFISYCLQMLYPRGQKGFPIAGTERFKPVGGSDPPSPLPFHPPIDQSEFPRTFEPALLDPDTHALAISSQAASMVLKGSGSPLEMMGRIETQRAWTG